MLLMAVVPELTFHLERLNLEMLILLLVQLVIFHWVAAVLVLQAEEKPVAAVGLLALRLLLGRAGCRPRPHPTTGTTMTTTLSCGPLGQNLGRIRCIGFAPWGP